jgi:murein L,D-transpeptidase YafK
MTSGLTKAFRLLAGFLSLVAVAMVLAACGGPSVNAKANKPLSSGMVQKLALMGSSPGEAMMIRIFKESSELEIWKRTRGGEFRLLVSYEICTWSGELGPKIKEGDRQAPEGFYTITPGLLNPNSSYYLAFNTGFPNKFDRAWGRTGANLMVHGDCSSAGCYAMTDEQIEEIYALARESFRGGNTSFQLQIYPFRMTPANIARHASSTHLPFWNNLKEGYDSFEVARRPPVWDVCDRRYVFNVPTTVALDAVAACPTFEADATMVAALTAKQEADAAAVARELTAIEDREERAAAIAAREAEEAARAAEAEAAAKARGEAIGSFFSNMGSAIGNTLGLGNGKPPEAATPKVIDPTLVAPIPAPRIRRS